MDAKLELLEHVRRDGDQHDFSITLKHAVCEIPSSLINNPLGIAPEDVRAPARVPCFELQKIDISMSFRNTRVNLKQSPKQADNFRGPETLDSFWSSYDKDFDLLLELKQTEDRLFSQCTAGDSSQAASSILDSFVEDSLCEDDEMLDTDLLLYQTDSTLPSLTRESLAQSSLFSVSMQKSRMDSIADAAPNKATASLSLDLPYARKMIDFALRILIGGRQIKSQPGVKLMRPYPTQSLSQIAPALWSPGFLQVRLVMHLVKPF